MNKFSKAIKRGITAGVLVAVASISLAFANSTSAGTTVSGPRDCDGGSVIYCGALSTEELVQDYNKNSYGDLPGIYNAFGISGSDVAGLNSRTVVGSVHANGNVYVGDKLIGINAITAGRTKTTHSVAIPGTKAYKRPPSDSFARPTTTIQIFIGYHGDNPSWAVISSCGNPLTWDAPDLELDKTVAKAGTNNFKDHETFKDGEKATYKLTVRETTGRAALHTVGVSDILPTGFTFVPGSIKVNGVSKPGASLPSVSIGTMPAGSTATVTFDAIAKFLGKECGSNLVTNLSSVAAVMQDPDFDNATADITKVCVPVFSCKSLNATIPSVVRPGQKLTFALEAGEVKHTNITAFVFKVNGVTKQQNKNDANFSYTVPSAGNYKVTGHIRTAAGETAEKASCTKTFNVEDEPVVVTACKSLTGPVDLKVGQTGNYVATATAQNTTATEYSFTVNGKVEQTGKSTNFAYKATTAGDVKIQVTVKFANGDVKTSNACMKTVKVTPVVVTACKSLTGPTELKVGQTGTYVATATAQHTTVIGYDFSVNKKGGPLVKSNKFEYTPNAAGEAKIQVVVHFANGDVKTSNACMKTVKVTEDEKVVVCKSLTVDKLVAVPGEDVTFTLEGDAEFTEIVRYRFDVNGTVGDSDDNTLVVKAEKAGSFTVRGYVISSDGQVVTSDDCVKTVEVVDEEEPVYRCELFTLSKNKVYVGEQFTVKLQVIALNGATFKSATFNFDDTDANSKVVEEIADGMVTVTHKYTKAGDYNPKATIAFEVNGETVTLEDPNCAGTMNVSEKDEPCDLPGKSHLPKNSPECQEEELCTVPGKTHLPKNDPKCRVPVPEVKGVSKVLPNTGAGDILGMFTAVTAAGTLGHRSYSIRRRK